MKDMMIMPEVRICPACGEQYEEDSSTCSEGCERYMMELYMPEDLDEPLSFDEMGIYYNILFQ